MQDEINEKIVALSIRAGTQGFRVTSSVLKAAMRKYLQNGIHGSSIWTGLYDVETM